MKKRRQMLLNLIDFISVVGIEEYKIISALQNNDFKDYEDCLQDECAADCAADFIVTRNVNDYSGSKVMAISPGEVLQLINTNA